MVDRTDDLMAALRAEAKVQGDDEKSIIISPPNLKFRTDLARECRDLLKKTVEKEREIKLVSAEVLSLAGGFLSSGSKNDAFLELESTELEALTFCSAGERRLLEIAKHLEDTRQMEYPNESIDPKQCNKWHQKAVVFVTYEHLGRLSTRIRSFQQVRQRKRKEQEIRRAKGTFAPSHLTDEEIKNFQAVTSSSRDNPQSSMEIQEENEANLHEPSRFLQENKQLQMRLEKEATQNVELSEGKLIEMSTMMTAFTEKVFKQHETVDEILETEEKARETTKAGVEQIQIANDRSKGQQIWLLSILLMASFSVLFLDWYGA
mmetsp:Transcript_9100/g.13647  ORF Transcript_9100/g.13647 Transcript_9100/m.13647 type:complete len:319 (+) Transcript_9100:33-989(+)